MNISRRQAVLSTLFGAGYVGLRSLATGLPAALLLDPRRALADVPPTCADASKAQFIVLATSGSGDPLNANVPGCYDDPNIVHPSPADGSMAPTPLTLGGKSYTAAAPWAALPQALLDRTCFWHIMTDTPAHPDQPKVHRLMGATRAGEMLPSLLAKHLAPCLGTVQAQPMALGATSPSEALSFGGQTLPVLPPTALKTTLLAPTGPLGNLQPLRDQALSQLYELYKNGATPAQRAYIDSMVNSQRELRNVNQTLLSALDSIKDNSAASQVKAAVILIQMKVSPVISIHIPFGGDNHRDSALATEAAQTKSGVAIIAALMEALASAQLTDQVTFMTLDVFGRTIGPSTKDGRQHNPNHQVSITIGKGIKPGVIGGVTKGAQDYDALPIDSATGKGTASGDVTALASLASFGKTMLASVGAPQATIDQQILSGKVVSGALA